MIKGVKRGANWSLDEKKKKKNQSTMSQLW